MTSSCKEFVAEARSAKGALWARWLGALRCMSLGRPTLFLHVTAGSQPRFLELLLGERVQGASPCARHKAPAFLFLNPPLQVLSLKVGSGPGPGHSAV